jgi:hypothetical protein
VDAGFLKDTLAAVGILVVLAALALAINALQHC